MLELLLGLTKKELEIEVTKLFSNDSVNTFLGLSIVAISGDGNVIVANTNNDPNTGTVCVFVREENGWVQKASLLAGDRATSDQFGSSASISYNGDVIAIGARNDDDKGNDSGSAYVFVKNGSTWSEQAKLTANDGAAVDRFGQSVFISRDGNTIIVGASQDDDKGNDSGSVYIYVRSGNVWSQQAKLIASDGAAIDQFGISVSISEEGSVIFIGANNYRESGFSIGAVYLFEKVEEMWEFKIKFTSGISNGNQGFGISVSTNANGNKTIIGASNTSNGLGAAYIFYKISANNYKMIQLLPDPNAIPSNLGSLGYGSRTAISSNGKRIIVSAPRESKSTINNAGALYFYDLN